MPRIKKNSSGLNKYHVVHLSGAGNKVLREAEKLSKDDAYKLVACLMKKHIITVWDLAD